MKSAVIFAGYFPYPHRTNTYINCLKTYFSDCDVYIGLNSSHRNIEELLIKEGFPNISHTPKSLECTSDASAYQTALQMFKIADMDYDNVYFLHTKGVSYGGIGNDDAWRISCNEYLIEFCKGRTRIESILTDEPTIGGVFPIGRLEGDMVGYNDTLSKYCTFPCEKFEKIMSLITLYCIRGNIVRHFLDNVNESFWETKLDRYWFEAVFPLIVDRMGYNRKHLGIWK